MKKPCLKCYFSFLPVIICGLFFETTKAEVAHIYSNDATDTTINIAELPAITLQFCIEGKIKSQYTKLNGQANFGLWIALDQENNRIHYKILQKDCNAIPVNIEKIKTEAEDYFTSFRPLLEETFQEVIDFQSLKNYLNSINHAFLKDEIPNIADLNGGLLSLVRKSPLFDKVAIGETKLDVDVTKKLASSTPGFINKAITYLQKKNFLISEDISELNNALQSVYSYPSNLKISEHYDANVSFHINRDASPVQHDDRNYYYILPYPYYPPSFINYGQLAGRFRKKNLGKKSNIEYETYARFNLYLPPQGPNYGDAEKVKAFAEKLFQKTLTSNPKTFLTPNAPEELKYHLSNFTKKILVDIKEGQEKIEHAIDKACETINGLFE